MPDDLRIAPIAASELEALLPMIAAYQRFYEVRDDHEEVDRRLAYWLQSFREENHPAVERLTSAFELAGFALLVEIAFLAVGLAVS